MFDIFEMRLKYLQVARECTGSTNIDVLIQTAKRIEGYVLQDDDEDRYDATSFDDFCQKLMIQHPFKGAIPLQMFDFQRDIAKTISDNPRVIINSSRQMGMTMLFAAHALWIAAHNPKKSVLLIAPKYSMALETMERMHFMIEHGSAMMPFITMKTKNKIIFGNGSEISCTTASSPIRGTNYSNIYVQDAAYISYAHEDSFWEEMILQCHSGARCVVQSTPNKKQGLFYNLWNETSTNSFVPIHLPWNAHPYRNEQWAIEMGKNLGDESFKREFEAEFID